MILDKIFKNEKGEYISFFDFMKSNGNFDNYIYTLAEAHAIDLIARTIAKCEIQTFEMKDRKVQNIKGDLYWTLNKQPNFIENGTAFLYKLVVKLLEDRTALVIINKKLETNLLYVADSYDASNDIFRGKTFSNITVLDAEGNSLIVKKTYNQNNTIYFSIKNDNLVSASDSFKTNTQTLLKAAQKAFQSANIPKWRLKSPGQQPTMIDNETGKPISYDEYKKKITEGLLSDEEAVVLLSELFNLELLNKDLKKSTDDYDNIVKSIGDSVARKWKIPLDIFYGNKTEKSTGNDDFITFAVDLYFEEIEDGLNVALVGKESFKKGEYIKINRMNIMHKDLVDRASGWDKLISSGFSFNQLCEMFGLPTIDEEWADEHYITKNYANVKGGAEEGNG